MRKSISAKYFNEAVAINSQSSSGVDMCYKVRRRELNDGIKQQIEKRNQIEPDSPVTTPRAKA
jgi:hypothetical protein